MTDLPRTMMMRLPAVIQQVALSRSQIYALMARGEFPRPHRLSERTVAWTSESIESWLADRIAAAVQPGSSPTRTKMSNST